MKPFGEDCVLQNLACSFFKIPWEGLTCFLKTGPGEPEFICLGEVYFSPPPSCQMLGPLSPFLHGWFSPLPCHPFTLLSEVPFERTIGTLKKKKKLSRIYCVESVQ